MCEEEIIFRWAGHRHYVSVDVMSICGDKPARPNRRAVQPAVPGDELRLLLRLLIDEIIILRYFFPPGAGQCACSLLYLIAGTAAEDLNNDQGIIRPNLVPV